MYFITIFPLLLASSGFFRALQPIQINTWLVTMLFLGIFTLGYSNNQSLFVIKLPSIRAPAHKGIVIQLFLGMGILSCIIYALSNFSDFTNINIVDIYAERSRKAASLTAGDAYENPSLMRLAFLSYQAGVPALVYLYRSNKSVGRSLRPLIVVYLLTLALVAVSSGGRSAIISLLFLLSGAALCNWRDRIAVINLTTSKKILLLLVFVTIIIYSVVVFIVRQPVTLSKGMEMGYFYYMQWGVGLTQNVESFLEGVMGPLNTVLVFQAAFYMVQSPFILERLLTIPDSVLLLGSYQSDIVAALIRMTGSQFLEGPHQTLLDADIYGFFAGSIGATLIDFSFFGGLAFFWAWGAIVAKSWKIHPYMCSADNLRTLPVFWISSIFWSFISPPFGFSNGTIMFLWFVLFDLSLPRSQSITSNTETRKTA